MKNVSTSLPLNSWGCFNALTGNAKHSVQDYDNLLLPNQIRLSGKRKKFSQFFVPFLQSTSNFKRFEEKDNRYS